MVGVKTQFSSAMSSKLINLSIGRYLLSAATLTLLIPSVACADSGNIGISLQVVPKCNIPHVINPELSQGKDITQHLDIKCSARVKPADVKVFTVPATTQAFNPVLEHQNDSVNILVTY